MKGSNCLVHWFCQRTCWEKYYYMNLYRCVCVCVFTYCTGLEACDLNLVNSPGAVHSDPNWNKQRSNLKLKSDLEFGISVRTSVIEYWSSPSDQSVSSIKHLLGYGTLYYVSIHYTQISEVKWITLINNIDYLNTMAPVKEWDTLGSNWSSRKLLKP